MMKQGWIAGLLLLLLAAPGSGAGNKACWEPLYRMEPGGLDPEALKAADKTHKEHYPP